MYLSTNFTDTKSLVDQLNNEFDQNFCLYKKNHKLTCIKKLICWKYTTLWMFEWMISNSMGVKLPLLPSVLKLGIIIHASFSDHVHI